MYKTIKAKSVTPGRHTVRVQFAASGREAEVKALGKRTVKGVPQVRVERFGWMNLGETVQVVK